MLTFSTNMLPSTVILPLLFSLIWLAFLSTFASLPTYTWTYIHDHEVFLLITEQPYYRINLPFQIPFQLFLFIFLPYRFRFKFLGLKYTCIILLSSSHCLTGMTLSFSSFHSLATAVAILLAETFTLASSLSSVLFSS